jgi:predicted nucleic acid-binding protein
MHEADAFIDTNVLIYLLSKDEEKADCTEAVLQSASVISVQVLNEMVNVARRKLTLSWEEIAEFSDLIRALCSVKPLTIETHDKDRTIAERYKLSVYDAMIVSAALLADCKTLYSEDMQDGLLIDDQLRIINPFN